MEQETTLRPRGLSDILDGAFALYRQNFALFAGIVAIFAIPQAIVNFLLGLIPAQQAVTTQGQVTTFHSDALGTLVAVGVAQLLIGVVFNTLQTGALARAIAYRYLGEKSTIRGAYESMGLRTFLYLLAASILQPVLLLVPLAVAFGAGFGLIALGVPIVGGIIIGVAGTATVVFVFIAYVRWTFVPQAIAIERQGPIAGLLRSWRLSRGSFWRILGYHIILSILVSVAVAATVGVASGLAALASGTIAGGARSALGAVVNIIVQPVQFGVLTLLYYDLRIRREGFDLEFMARAMSGLPQR